MNKKQELLLEGIIVVILFILLLIGHSLDTNNFFTFLTRSPLFIIVIIASLGHWSYKSYREYKK